MSLQKNRAALLALTVAVLAATALRARAELKLHTLFTDHAVLQQGMPVPVWGTADPGATVRVRFGGQTQTGKAGDDGAWMIALDALTPSATPRSLTVESGNHKRTITDLLVGEVWICSGQSNMARSMGGMNDKADVLAEAESGKLENIRLFKAPLRGTGKPQREVDASWAQCTQQSVNTFSAAGFYFGRALHRSLKIPVGLIMAAEGGTNAHCWISKDTLENAEVTTAKRQAFRRQLANYPAAWKLYEQALLEWNQREKAAKSLGKALEEKPPREPMGPNNPRQPAGLYNGMVAPLQPCAIAGVVWYQGESNAGMPSATHYKDLMLALVDGWRKDWMMKGPGGEKAGTRRDFPFYLVQLPNFAGGHPRGWPVIREQMLEFWRQGKRTGMVVTIDIGDPEDIHPQNKRIVGDRLARFARGDLYGENIVVSGPIYRSMTAKDGAIRLEFDHSGGGLTAADGKPLRCFTIAGADGKFVDAEARIDGTEKLVVSSPAVKEPKAARYAWSNNPESPNLFNKDGLPASPFRTDDWEIAVETQSGGAPAGDPFLWAIRAGGVPSGEKVRSLAVGEDGYTYITGQFAGEADFGEHHLSSRGGADCFVAKIDGKGKFVWARQIGGEAIERGYGIDADQQGHVFVTGHFQSQTLTFAGEKVTTSGDYDAFTASYDKDGNERWIRTGGGPAYDYGHGLDVFPGGGCVVAGRMVGPATLGKHTLETKEKASRLFVARYGDDGDLIWAKAGGEPVSASADDVAVDQKGNVWVGGKAYKDATYDGTPLGKAEAGSMLAAKISGADGSLIWATRFGGKAEGHVAGIIADEVNGGCYIAGAFEGELREAGGTLTSMGDKDILVARLDAGGKVEWIRRAGGAGWDLALGIGIDAAGNALVTGFVTEQGSFGEATPSISGPAREGFVASYDRRGKLLWLVENGGADNEINEDVAADKEGNVVYGGGFQTEGIFGRIKLEARSEGKRGQDIFVAKFRPPAAKP